MRRTRTAVCALALALGMSFIPVGDAAAAPTVSDLLEKSVRLEQQKTAKEEELEKYEEEYQALLAEVAKLEAEMVATGTEIAGVRRDLAAAERQMNQQYDEMKLRIQYIFENGGDQGLLTMILESQDLADLVTNTEYIKKVHEFDREKLQELRAAHLRVRALKNELDRQMAALETQQQAFQTKQKDMTDLMTTIETKIGQLDEEIQQALGEVGRLFGVEGSIAPYAGAADTEAAQAIIQAAAAQLGVPYVWGGTSPGRGLDCSGLTQYAHRAAGISIPRTSGEQLGAGQVVSDPQPGDIAWTPGHVGIYIGDGKMIEAPRTGLNVRISKVRAAAYVRYW